MTPNLAGVFLTCMRVGAKGATCGSKTALSHLLRMQPPACVMCGRRVSEHEIEVLKAEAGKATP